MLVDDVEVNDMEAFRERARREAEAAAETGLLGVINNEGKWTP
jgi:hypothetical protein